MECVFAPLRQRASNKSGGAGFLRLVLLEEREARFDDARKNLIVGLLCSGFLKSRKCRIGRSRTPAHRAAVHALVASAAADHDRAAVRTGRRVLLIQAGDAADARHRRAAAGRLGGRSTTTFC